MKFSRSSVFVFTVVVPAAMVAIAFQNCAKSPNLANYGPDQSSSTTSSSQSSGSSQTQGTVTIYQSNPSQLTAQTGASFNLNYAWSATAPLSSNLTVFVHIVDANGNIAFQDDHNPPTPTTQWNGQIGYTRTVTVPANIPAGNYTIWAGLYDLAGGTGARLPLVPGPGLASSGDDQYEIGTLTVTAPPPVITKPVITSAPQSVSVIDINGNYYTGTSPYNEGSPVSQVSFTVGATGANLTYRWYVTYVTQSGSSTTVDTGNTTSTITDPVTVGNTLYTVVVSNSAGSVTEHASLTVTSFSGF